MTGHAVLQQDRRDVFRIRHVPGVGAADAKSVDPHLATVRSLTAQAAAVAA